ncbi:hypothetical protein QQZ08_005264 [Neonectria magnoliae]|uniref:Uncharacterized protein n=1 Tax=Neonectria magnoliae TaxID=2732573 RepID=A0ABR1I3T6_9HYPO
MKYPGFGLDLRYHDQFQSSQRLYPIGVHTNCYGAKSEMLLVREVAMMIVMDRLSDKPDWHLKVFDDAIVKKWTEEALALPVEDMYDEIVRGKMEVDGDGTGDSEQGGYGFPKRLNSLLDKECLDYCIKELRAKAEYFKKTGVIPTLDAAASVAKSDALVDAGLHDALRAAFAKLKDEQKDDPDWHPRTNGKVQDLVHPSLYPLVYGRSRVFEEEVVDVDNAIDKWAGSGDVIPQLEPDIKRTGRQPWSRWSSSDHTTSIGGSRVHPSYWSTKYQWLPANVKFQDDGTVKFTSYINNLHPGKHRDIYGTIEKLIEKSLPAWDLCLAQYRNYNLVGAGRTESRFPQPENPDDENEENWTPPFDEVVVPEGAFENEEDDDVEEEDENGNHYSGTPKQIQWYKTRRPVQPAPPKFKAWDYEVKEGDYLREQFNENGLQIIVKMASIELTPDKPAFPPGGWHVEGQMNEHIVGTALYYLDSENVTPSHLQFRMQTDSYQDDWEVGQGTFTWMEQVYGTNLGSGSGGTCLQNYGSVKTKEGRLLAFPNVFHHRISPFQLRDPTKPGHRRFIALWLVDPFTRILSTANVPPQQQDWWLERAFGDLSDADATKVPQAIANLILEKAPGYPGLEAVGRAGLGLPAELMDLVRDGFGDALPMSPEEAKKHRLELMEARTAFQDEAREKWE